MNVTDMLRRASLDNETRPALTQGDTTLAFGEAWERGVRLANGLLELGLRPGDRVATLEDNSIEAADTLLGTAIAGLVRVPLYARNATRSHQTMMRTTDCRALLVSENYVKDVAGVDVASLEHVVVRDEAYDDWLRNCSTVDPLVERGLDDEFLIRHTGGTTGSPKGVAYTHRMWTDTIRDWLYAVPEVSADDTFAHFAPISHGSGYWFLPVWVAGARNLLVSSFDPKDTIDLLRRERVTHTALVPVMFDMLAAVSLEVAELPDLRCINVGTAPSSPATLGNARTIFGDRLYSVYAQTEVTPIACMSPTEWFDPKAGYDRITAVGRPAPFTEVITLDLETRAVLPRGDIGEVAVRCAGQMQGYVNDPVATAESLHNGYVLTGDVGYLDPDGYLHLLDRRNDMVITGGFNVWPAEIETVLARHDDVLEVVAFGLPDSKWGEAPHAVVRLRPGSVVDASQLIQLCREELGSYKKPASIHLVDEPLPRSPVGKLLRREVRATFLKEDS